MKRNGPVAILRGLACAALVAACTTAGTPATGSPSATNGSPTAASSVAPTPAPTPTARTGFAGELTFGRADPSTGHFVVYLVGADGSNPRVLLLGVHDVTRWSHDGTTVAAASFGKTTLFPTLYNADGSLLRELHPDPTLNLGAMAWSRDDQWLAFEAWDDGDASRAGIYLMHPDGTKLHRITGGGVPGDFSIDDRELVYTLDDELHVTKVDGTGDHRIGTMSVGLYPGFMPNGSIYATSAGHIWIIDPATGVGHPIDAPGGTAVEPRLSADGLRFVFSADPAGSGSTGIWWMNADGTGATEVINAPQLEEVFADWKP